MQTSIKTGAAIIVAVFASVGAAMAQNDAPPPATSSTSVVNQTAPAETAPASGATPAEAGQNQATAAPAEAPAKPAILPHDLTPMGMFLAASPVVQAVMIGLALASVQWL